MAPLSTGLPPTNYQICPHCQKLLHRSVVWRHRREAATNALPAPLPVLGHPAAGHVDRSAPFDTDDPDLVTTGPPTSDDDTPIGPTTGIAGRATALVDPAPLPWLLNPDDSDSDIPTPPPHSPSTPPPPIPLLPPVLSPDSILDTTSDSISLIGDATQLLANLSLDPNSDADDAAEEPPPSPPAVANLLANDAPPVQEVDLGAAADGPVADLAGHGAADLQDDQGSEASLLPGDLLDNELNGPLDTPLELALLWDLNAARHRAEVGLPADSPSWLHLKMYKYQMEVNLSFNSYAKLRNLFQSELPLPPLRTLRQEMRDLTGIKPTLIDCCRNSCICFYGKYADLADCPTCDEPRLRPNGQPASQFQYFSIIPQVQALYGGFDSANAMLYWATHMFDNVEDIINVPNPDRVISDIYDSSLFRHLFLSNITVDDDVLDRRYFEDSRDVLLVGQTDGFNLFKKAKDTCWPILFINMNLSPKIRYRLSEQIVAGMIPGPNKPKDHDSFTAVIVDDLKRAARGVQTYNAVRDEMFDLRIFAPYMTGDIPAAAAAFTGGKQHGAIHPCRICPIEGIRIRDTRNMSHYLPLTRPPDYPPSLYSLDSLPPNRTHAEWIEQAAAVEAATTQAQRSRLSQRFGINRLAVTSQIPSFTFPWSVPYEFLHLLYNMISNYLDLFSGDFKGLDDGVENYAVPAALWADLGEQTVNANATIPSAFGRSICNLTENRSYATAESLLVWALYYSPVLLYRVLPAKYWQHWMRFISILERTLAYETTQTQRDVLRLDIAQWYGEYEEYFYQFNEDRLPTCLLVLHAWLHIPDLMERSGPLWVYWSWSTERLCGVLGRAIASKKNPFASLNIRIGEINTIHAARHMFGLQECLPPYTVMYNSVHTSRFSHISCSDIEFLHHSLTPTTLNLTRPCHRSLKRRISIYLGTQHDVPPGIAASAIPTSVQQWGRVQIRDDDIIRTTIGNPIRDPNERDALFAEYELLVDRLAHRRNAAPEFERRTFFGQVERALVVEVPPSEALRTTSSQTLLLCDIRACRANFDGKFWLCPAGSPFGAYEVVHAKNLRALVGRIIVDNKWYFIRRSGIVEHAAFDLDH